MITKGFCISLHKGLQCDQISRTLVCAALRKLQLQFNSLRKYFVFREEWFYSSTMDLLTWPQKTNQSIPKLSAVVLTLFQRALSIFTGVRNIYIYNMFFCWCKSVPGEGRSRPCMLLKLWRKITKGMDPLELDSNLNHLIQSRRVGIEQQLAFSVTFGTATS
jgi:hypothetical protein